MNLSASPTPPWYELAFGELYPAIYSHRDDASARREILALARTLGLEHGEGAGQGGLRVLDVCCGDGRHAVALAALGLEVWGVDLSARLLARARRRRALRGRLAQADIRALPFASGAFDLAVNLFTSFGYFEEDAENDRALREMARVVRPGGRLALDHMNRETALRRLRPRDEIRRDGLRILQTREAREGRILKRIEVFHEETGKVSRIVENVRLYTPAEMQAMFERAGFETPRLYGAYDGAPLAPESERMIAVGVRRRGA